LDYPIFLFGLSENASKQIIIQYLLCKFKDFPAEYKMFTSQLQRGL